MLPRRQIREAIYAAYAPLTEFTTKDRGRIPRYQEQDLPAVNITTYDDRVTTGYAVHGGCKDIGYEQTFIVEIYDKVKDNFEDDMDDLEEALWRAIAPVFIAGVEITYQGSTLTPVKDAEHPQAVRLLTFTATYSVNQSAPNIII